MFTINAEIRKKTGKSSSRRLLLTNKLPAIIYGSKKNSINIEIFHKDIIKNKEDLYKDILIIIINETKHKVKIKEIQNHPFKNKIIHIDFIRI